LSREEVLRTGARLLGLYFVAVSLIEVPQVFTVWELAASTPNARPLVVALTSASQSALAIVIGLLLFIFGRASRSGAQPHGEPHVQSVFPSMLQLLGVYLAFNALGPLVRAVSESVTISASWQFHVGRIGAELVSLGAGLFLVLRAQTVARWLHDVRTEP
jgi:hypothetical protein